MNCGDEGTFLRVEHGRQPLITVRGTTLAEMIVGQPALPTHPSPTMAWGSYSEGASWSGDAFLSPTDVAATSAAGGSDSKYYGSGLRFEDNVHYGPSYVFGETHQVVKNNLFLAEGSGACGGQGACPGTRMLQFAGSGTLRFEGNLLAGNRIGGWIEHGCDGLAEHWRDGDVPRRRTSSGTNLTQALSLSLSRPDPGAATSRRETSSAGTSPAAAARCRSTRSATRSASPRTASRGARARRFFRSPPRARVSLSLLSPLRTCFPASPARRGRSVSNFLAVENANGYLALNQGIYTPCTLVENARATAEVGLVARATPSRRG